MNTVKHERFCKVVEKRMATMIRDYELLGKCASKVSYDYTEEEVEKIFAELRNQMEILRDRFNGKKAFSLATKE